MDEEALCADFLFLLSSDSWLLNSLILIFVWTTFMLAPQGIKRQK